MYKRFFFIILINIAAGIVGPLWAADVASFVDLGFSADGRYYMFGQYGVEANTLKPWAELFVVDVPKNNFVPGGKLSYMHDNPIIQGQDGTGALYTLLADNGPLFKKYNIDFLRQSRPLYLAMDGNSSVKEADPSIDFRDFESGDTFRAALVHFEEGTGDSLKSSFYINLERTGSDGTKKNYLVGSPSIKRPLITSYRICRVMIAPKDGSMIFVIEMTKKSASGSGNDIRYMIEAIHL